MKKFATVITIVLIAMVSIFASPLPFELELDFDLDYLVDMDFDLSIDDDGLIVIEPPDYHWEDRDLIVEEFCMVDTSEIGEWFLAIASFEDYATYDDIYYYVADELGEDGLDADDTIEFINLFYDEPSEDDIADLLLSGDLAEFMGDAIPAQMIIDIIEESGAELEYINAWLYDDLTIYTLMADGEGLAIYVNNDVMYDLMDTVLGEALLEGLLE